MNTTMANDMNESDKSSTKSSKVFSVRVSREFAARIHYIALARGVTPSRLISAMLDDYLNQKAREEFMATLVEFERRREDNDQQLAAQLLKLGNRIDGVEALLQQALSVD